MDLYGALCVLYLLQCFAWVPGGAWLFVETLFGPVIAAGPGFRLLHPLPSARSHLGRRFPLEGRAGSLRGRDGADWRARRGDRVELADLREAATRGAQVRVAGRPFARGADPDHAERLAAALHRIGGAVPDAARQQLEAEIAEGFSLESLRAAQARFDSHARVLAWISDAYWLSLFVVAPAVAWSLGTAFSLPFLAPALVALHVATLASFAVAHARLHPGGRAERFEFLFGAAVYPPAALRAHQHLRDAALGSYHPAAIAALVLPGDRARAFVRGELARAIARASEEEGAVRRLVAELGDSPVALLAEPARTDPWALAYCPACGCEYRRESDDCVDCRIPLARWRFSDPA